MLRFFRGLRNSSLNQNKFSKYLLYAIGEIVLVVIGILLALQINLWKEERQERIAEIKTLKEIREGLLFDKADLEMNINALQDSYNSSRIVLHHFDNNLPYHDSLQKHFGAVLIRTRFISKDGPYEVLKSQGIAMITNDEVRKAVVDIYDRRYESLRTWQDGFYVNDQAFQDYVIELFDKIEIFKFSDEGMTPGNMIPHDYKGLKSDKKYKAIVTTLGNQNKQFQIHTNTTRKEVISLIEDLEREIERLEKD